jgi:hypothetical protein
VATDASQEDALRALHDLGVSRPVAKQLLAQYPLDHVVACARECSRRLAGGWLPRESPAAWTVAAIKHPEWNIGRVSAPPAEPPTPQAPAVAAVPAVEAPKAPLEPEGPPPSDGVSARGAIEDVLGIGPGTRRVWATVVEAIRDQGIFTNALHAAFLLPIRGRTATLVIPAPVLERYLVKIHEPLQRALRDATGNPRLRLRIEYRQLRG